MKANFLLTILFVCFVVAVPTAYGQSCGTGLVRVCVTPLVCACLLPGGGSADPIMKDFVGNKFEFFGEPGSFYNLYSDTHHQVNIKLFPGFVDGHEGTYMGAFGLAFHEFRVNVTLLPEGDIQVEAWQELPFEAVPPKHSVLASGEASYTMVGQKNGQTLSITTEPFRPEHGRSVDIVSGTLELNVWAIPPGLVDSHNVTQPAYLNFNLTLLTPPAGDNAEGIIGESLAKAVELQKKRISNLFAESLEGNPTESKNVATFDGKGLTNDYRVEGMFGADFAFNLYGEKQPAKITRRALMDNPFAGIGFPVYSTSA